MDDLRTRIAAALQRADEQCASLALADAVIRELGLRQELGDYDGFFGREPRHRYVTDWVST